MIGDADHSGQHQHGVKESARPASGMHLMSRKPIMQKQIEKVGVSFRGHLLLTFVDGTTYELQRGDYPHNVPPKVGEFYPPPVPEEAEKPLDEALAEGVDESHSESGKGSGQAGQEEANQDRGNPERE